MSSPGFSIRAYARHRRERGLVGASPWSVQKALREGRIERNAEGKIEPEIADRQWEENTNPAMRRPSAPSSSPRASATETSHQKIPVPPLAQSRAIREAYQARLARLDYEERTGTLVSTEQVRSAAFARARSVRERLLTLPERVASELAAITDPRGIREVLESELQQALEELSRG